MTKREQWEQIKSRAPELAKFLMLVKEKFGRPKNLEVRWKS